ncbi:DUF4873 domain-containing protein [Spinactinospora alkalitolerans]
MGDEEEEYRGPATAVIDGREAAVRVHLAGHFDPLTGGYRWVGRIAANPEVTACFETGRRSVLIRTPDGAAEGVLAEPDVWGGHPVSGAGRPPFPVPEVLAEDLED